MAYSRPVYLHSSSDPVLSARLQLILSLFFSLHLFQSDLHILLTMKSRIILCTIFAVVLMKSPSASANRFEIEGIYNIVERTVLSFPVNNSLFLTEMIRRMRLENENLLNNFDSATEIDKDEDEVEIPEDYDEDVPLPESQNSQQVKQSPAMSKIDGYMF